MNCLFTKLDVNLNKWRIANNDLNLKRMIANEFVVRFVDMMKREYGHQFEPLVIQETQFVKLKHWGELLPWPKTFKNLKLLTT